MRMLTRVLVWAFFLQYYLTLAISIGLNLLKKALGWLRGGKDVPSIHPFHNAHEEVFSWKGKAFKMQRISLDYRDTHWTSTALRPGMERKFTCGASAGNHPIQRLS
jgi:hypothetical protein